MKPTLTYLQGRYPKSWQALPNGDVIKNAIEQELAPWWQTFFGYHLVKIGALSSEIETPKCTIKHQVNISGKGDLTTIEANIDHLPLQKQSVDVCLLSHSLEFALDPHHVVREANRVLIPNGYLVISGYNPLSLVGLNRLLPYRRTKTPWNEHFFSPMRVKDWLHLMGYEILADQRCLHSSLTGKLTTAGLQQKWHCFAQRYFPSLGSVYVIVAKKRVLPLTPIKPKWQIRSSFQPVKVASMNTPKNQPTITKKDSQS